MRKACGGKRDGEGEGEGREEEAVTQRLADFENFEQIIESSARDGSNGWIEEDNRTMKDKETKDKREKEKRQRRRGIVPSTID